MTRVGEKRVEVGVNRVAKLHEQQNDLSWNKAGLTPLPPTGNDPAPNAAPYYYGSPGSSNDPRDIVKTEDVPDAQCQ